MADHMKRRTLLTRGGLALIGASAINAQKPTPKTPPASAAKAKTAIAPSAPTARRSTPEPASYGRSSNAMASNCATTSRLRASRFSAAPGRAWKSSTPTSCSLLDNIRFDALSQAGKVDYLLLRTPPAAGAEAGSRRRPAGSRNQRHRSRSSKPSSASKKTAGAMETIDGQKTAITLTRLVKDIAVAKDSIGGRQSRTGRAQPRRAAPGATAHHPAHLVRLLRPLRSQIRLVGGRRIQEGR